MLNLVLKKTLQGNILDIGGGGEGIMGRIYQAQVTAIDNRQEELDEAPGGFRKLLMDARALAFPDASFDHVTAFYALMYMSKPVQAQAVAEAARVLRSVVQTVMENARQDAAYFTELCNSAGLCLVEQKGALDGFYLRFIK